MDKVAILTASTTGPSVTIRQKSDYVKTYVPELSFALRVSDAVGSALFFFIVQTLFFVRFALTNLFLASRTVLYHTSVASSFVAAQAVGLAKMTAWTIWKSKSMKTLRKKLEYEFFVLILGPGGNAMCLMLFWPGWVLFVAACVGLWAYAG